MAMGGRSLQLQLLHVFVFVLSVLQHTKLAVGLLSASGGGGDGDAKMRCIGREREALLMFKQDLIDDAGVLSSWGREEDCCKWRGVECSNKTGHVIMLDLGTSDPLRGKISSSLLELQHLNYLDLSFNDFEGSPIPEFIASLSRLTYLYLSRASLGGTVPHHLGNLTNLRSLDLSSNDFVNTTNLEWLSHLSLLQHLDLSGLDLSEAMDWQQAIINKLPSLTELRLSSCELPRIIPSSFPLINSSSSAKSLSVLDLSFNYLTPSIYNWLFHFNCSSLVQIDLKWNELRGPIPDDVFGNMVSLAHVDLSDNQLEGGVLKSFGNLTSLEILRLTYNNITGQLPQLLQPLSGRAEKSLEILSFGGNQLSGSLAGIKRFSSLRELYLYGNQLNGSLLEDYVEFPSLEVLDLSSNQIEGSLPDFTLLPSSLTELYLDYNRFNGSLTTSIGCLSKLNTFFVSSNDLEGVVSEAHPLFNLSRLRVLGLSFNSLALNFSSDWIPPFQLQSLQLAYCKLGPQFPKWLQTQKQLFSLDMSGARISDAIPQWFWDQSHGLYYLSLYHNQIYGMLPDLSLKIPFCSSLDLSSNNFSGPLPLVPPIMESLDLSKNTFSGSISFLCNTTSLLVFLDLSDNLLSGELPDCWHLEQLAVLNLANNNLSGNIPTSMSSFYQLQTLHLRNNSFIGELPTSLKNCTRLSFIDLAENHFSGTIPAWIGDSLSNLTVLSLRFNEFYGSIPLNICHLSHIQILDLSLNHISGTIPKCLNNLTAMAREESPSVTITHLYTYMITSFLQISTSYDDNAYLVWKGRESEYKNILGLVKIIDLSCNKISGDIPYEITSLVGLVGLNLSRNILTGQIDPKIGQLRWLDFLDLSRNQLSGPIPTSLSQLSHLGVLDLSNNNLSGRIPRGTQLQSFNDSAYMGNPGLCGAPLTKSCPGDETDQDPHIIRGSEDADIQQADDKFITSGFYISMGVGFTLAFWGIFGTLLIKDSWRYAYFKFLNNMEDWLYLTATVNMIRLKRWLQN